MEMRTRILGKMLNSEVQDYLQRNDIIIVPVGTTEMHGGFPLDCETVISEAFALKMAENCGIWHYWTARLLWSMTGKYRKVQPMLSGNCLQEKLLW